jgi:hypothetical protein
MVPYKPNRLYAVPQTLEKRLEIANAIRKLFGQDDFKKASPDDPQHRGWPAGAPRGQGGKFRPKDNSGNITTAAGSRMSEAECEAQYEEDLSVCRACIWMHVMVRRWRAIERVPQVTRSRRLIFRDEP